MTDKSANHAAHQNRNLTLFSQLFEPQSSTYTYIVGDAVSGDVVLIDPVLDTIDRDLKLLEELSATHGAKLKYVIDTHVHADHVTAAGEIRKRLGVKTAICSAAGIGCADIALKDGDRLNLGAREMRVMATPGHTNTCMCFHFDDMVFTGDTLLIRGNGRTDFQDGSASTLYDSIQKKLFALPPETKVFPGHDYRGFTQSTIALEKAFNPRIGGGKSKAEFESIMSELKLDLPKKIHEAVPANMACGNLNTGAQVMKGNTKMSASVQSTPFQSKLIDGIPHVSPAETRALIGKVRMIDVRRPDEYAGELGHVDGAELVTLGPDLEKFLDGGNREEPIIFICRSGGRSGGATSASIAKGYKTTANMTGGMLAWNEQKLPTIK